MRGHCYGSDIEKVRIRGSTLEIRALSMVE